MSSQFVPLATRVEIVAGQHIEAALYNTDGIGTPYLTGPDDFGEHFPVVKKWTSSPKVFSKSMDVLVTVKGAGVGKSNLGCDAAIGRQLMALRPIPGKSLQNFVYHFIRFKFDEIARLADGATVPGIGKADLASLKFPLLSLDEQRRIAAILDQADLLRRKRLKALAALRELPAAMFFALVGDPIFNPKGYERRHLIDCCEQADDIRCGPFGTQLLKEEFTEFGVPLWGIKQVNRLFKVETKEFVSEGKARQLSNYDLIPGDIVMTRKGTVGNCAIYPSRFVPGIMHSDLLRIRLSPQYQPEFISQQLRSSTDVLRQIELISGGAIMPGVNVGRLKAINVLCPPPSVQKRFAEEVAELDGVIASAEDHLTHLNSLFASLQHRAFRGEL